MSPLQKIIEEAWVEKDKISSENSSVVGEAVESVMALLDVGQLRVAEKKEGVWQTHHWIKKAILLSFRLRENQLFTCGPFVSSKEESSWFDKVPLKCHGWKKEDFQEAGFRLVPGAIIRSSAYIGEDTVIMPSFINVGAYIDRNTMVDTWATIGSCAQIGKNCHISGGVGIGGVLEPLQSSPIIIEDNCFIGARSEIAEGVLVEEGSVIAMGVFISASTKIVNRRTGEIIFGRIPPYSVVVPGTLPSSDAHGPSLACAVIVKQVDAQTRAKTGINDLLRA